MFFAVAVPTDVCLAGVESRRGKPRTDMPWIETEEDIEFTEFIKGFRANNRPIILALLEKYPEITVHTFKSRSESDAFLQNLQA